MALFIMASRGQCENTAAADKQVGGWAFLVTNKKKSNQCQRSHRMFEQKGPLETISSRFYFLHGGKKEGERRGRACSGRTASEEIGMGPKPDCLLPAWGSFLARQWQMS